MTEEKPLGFADEIIQMAAASNKEDAVTRLQKEALIASCMKRCDELAEMARLAARLLSDRGAPFSPDRWPGGDGPRGWPEGWEMMKLGSTFFKVVLTPEGHLLTVREDWEWNRREAGDLMEIVKQRLNPNSNVSYLEEQAKELTINLGQPVLAQLKSSVAEHIAKL